MIDVLLVLLIIFMAVCRHAKGDRHSAARSESDVAPANPKSDQIVLEVTLTASTSSTREKITTRQLEAAQGDLRSAPDKIIFIKGDP